jgi:hypothetical protein
MFQRIVLYATLGYLLDALGHTWDTWQFWTVFGLFWAADIMARREGYEAGMVFVARLPMDKLEEIKRAIARIEAKD